MSSTFDRIASASAIGGGVASIATGHPVVGGLATTALVAGVAAARVRDAFKRSPQPAAAVADPTLDPIAEAEAAAAVTWLTGGWLARPAPRPRWCSPETLNWLAGQVTPWWIVASTKCSPFGAYIARPLGPDWDHVETAPRPDRIDWDHGEV